MRKIGRPRKSERKENISVNLPKHIIDKVNDKLSWRASRSQWIEDAIKAKLGKKTASIANYSTHNLLYEAINRDDCDANVRFVIQMYLDSTVATQFEGIVTKQ